MPWAGTPSAGFTSGAPWLAPAPGWEQANVVNAEADPGSVLHLWRTLIEARNAHGSMGSAPFERLEPSADHPEKLLVFHRPGRDVSMLVALAFSDEPVSFRVVVPQDMGGTATLIASNAEVADPVPGQPLELSLPAYGYALWGIHDP